MSTADGDSPPILAEGASGELLSSPEDASPPATVDTPSLVTTSPSSDSDSSPPSSSSSSSPSEIASLPTESSSSSTPIPSIPSSSATTSSSSTTPSTSSSTVTTGTVLRGGEVAVPAVLGQPTLENAEAKVKKGRGDAGSGGEEDGSEEEEAAADDEGKSGYRKGGYHPVFVNEIYNSRYRISQKLGWGHFSTVWLARDTIFERICSKKRALEAQKAAEASPDTSSPLTPQVEAPSSTQVTPIEDTQVDTPSPGVDTLSPALTSEEVPSTSDAPTSNSDAPTTPSNEAAVIETSSPATPPTPTPVVTPSPSSTTTAVVKRPFFLQHSDVALKIVKSAAHYTEAAIDEIKILKVIARRDPDREKCVVCLLDDFKHRGPNGLHVCMVFELLGMNLYELLKKRDYRGLPLPIVQRIAKQILIGLDYLHSVCSIIHTDLKPENILLVPDTVPEDPVYPP
ncbi:MAG: protein kinase, partial [archaeon]|nr:protein kinase [archaeon]